MSSESLIAKSKEIESQMSNHISNLKAELETLQSKLQEEQEIAQHASAMGDRSENAEWQIANNNIARYVVSIMTLTDTLDTYETYKSSYQSTGKATLGSTLKVVDRKRNATMYIKLYPPGLGNAKIGAISVTAPLGAAVIGKEAGTEVVVKAPLGDIPYYIEEVL